MHVGAAQVPPIQLQGKPPVVPPVLPPALDDEPPELVPVEALPVVPPVLPPVLDDELPALVPVEAPADELPETLVPVTLGLPLHAATLRVATKTATAAAT